MSDIDVLLQENRSFPPPAAFRASARIHDNRIVEDAELDPQNFWAREAGELQWSKKWDRVLDWTPPHAQWFVGGELNASVNCVDRHIHGPRRNKAALVWEGEPGDRRTFTYWDLYREVNLAANMLKHLGVQKGDRVAIYLPMIPEAVIAMLACARIGAVHTVIFGGFSPTRCATASTTAAARCSSPPTADIVVGRSYRSSATPTPRSPIAPRSSMCWW